MFIISHRINSIKELKNVNPQDGIELDVRYHNDDIILCHDPFSHHLNNCEKFVDLVKEFAKNHRGLMIVNVKSEGIEIACLKILNQYKIKKWFFLDLSSPNLVKFANLAKNNQFEGLTADNLAVRFSEFEPIEMAISLKNSVGWVWVDCFNKMPLDDKNFAKLKSANFKICLVAPELQNHSSDRAIEFKELLTKFAIKIDAVCTKFPEFWR
jgi:hypothetical protein